ncbi:MAG: phenylalanine--tRNA ligase subunit alpha [Luteitalea sp.]|nr:phenylalanine--tRNA ligase subunit alpha [Luteitalea sp.]
MVDRAAIEHLRATYSDQLARAATIADLQALRDRFLGRKQGLVTALWREIAGAPPDDRRELGRLANELKAHIDATLGERRRTLSADKPSAPALDLTLPGRLHVRGARHPLSSLLERIERIFARMGYEILDGPEAEDDYHNFEALNMPPEHPARDMQDTLYLAQPLDRRDDRAAYTEVRGSRFEVRGSKGAGPAAASTPEHRTSQLATVLRTHTSSMQIRYMETHQPPVRIIAPGRVYRRDSLDVTHTPMFHQVEGLVVGEGVTMGDLKGTLTGFLRQLFGEERPVTFRPSFFPYTEPSADIFIGCTCRGAGCGVCKQTGWLEVLGSGMVHPAVFEAVGYDPERYTGFAFGAGIERIAMLLHGVDDIRLFYENDLRFLEQFPS